MKKLKNLDIMELSDKLLAWCFYLKREDRIEEENMPVLIKDDDTFKKAHEAYKRFTADDALMDAMEAHEKWLKDYNSRMGDAEEDGLERGLKQGLEQGLEQGREQGLEQGILRVARKMRELNHSTEAIAEATGLTQEEIDKLT